MTPQARKLGIAAGCRLAVLEVPAGWALQDPPPTEPAGETADVVLAFVRAAAELDAIADWGERIYPAGALWIAWPRRAGGHVSDVTENAIRAAALPLGLVDVKVAAIDADWSGLKLVWRRERRGSATSVARPAGG